MQKIIGQPAAINTLRQTMANERVHHAWMFHGPPGVGKFTTAMAFARQLLCHQPQADLAGQVEACGMCASCKLIDSPNAAHPDLHVITKELALYSDDRSIRESKQITIPVNVVRNDLLGPAYLKPQLNHGKVFIVDEADLLALPGQSALLKTLEEPPAGTYIILITAHEDRLLPTIRSRCQRVAFAELSDADVAAWLKENAADLNAERREWVLRFARGSIGRAVLAIQYELDGWVRRLEPMIDALTFGGGNSAELGSSMTELTDAFAEQWVKDHENASKDAANRQAMRLLMGLIGDMCRRRIAEESAGLSAGDPGVAEHRLAPWLGGIDLLTDAQRQMDSNVAMALLLDNLAVQWSVRAEHVNNQ